MIAAFALRREGVPQDMTRFLRDPKLWQLTLGCRVPPAAGGPFGDDDLLGGHPLPEGPRDSELKKTGLVRKPPPT